jgi:hypothetical protein
MLFSEQVRTNGPSAYLLSPKNTTKLEKQPNHSSRKYGETISTTRKPKSGTERAKIKKENL